MSGRRNKLVTITDEKSRDVGKKFMVREMSALAAEKWAMRVVNGAMLSGVNLGDIDAAAGMAALAGMAGMGILTLQAIAKMPWSIAEPLLDEMLTCVKPMSADGSTELDRLNADSVMEITTLLHLREEVASLHLGFSLAERIQTWMLTTLSQVSSIIQTFPEPSESSSQESSPPGRNSRRSSGSKTSTTS